MIKVVVVMDESISSGPFEREDVSGKAGPRLEWVNFDVAVHRQPLNSSTAKTLNTKSTTDASISIWFW